MPIDPWTYWTTSIVAKHLSKSAAKLNKPKSKKNKARAIFDLSYLWQYLEDFNASKVDHKASIEQTLLLIKGYSTLVEGVRT